MGAWCSKRARPPDVAEQAEPDEGDHDLPDTIFQGRVPGTPHHTPDGKWVRMFGWGCSGMWAFSLSNPGPDFSRRVGHNDPELGYLASRNTILFLFDLFFQISRFSGPPRLEPPKGNFPRRGVGRQRSGWRPPRSTTPQEHGRHAIGWAPRGKRTTPPTARRIGTRVLRRGKGSSHEPAGAVAVDNAAVASRRVGASRSDQCLASGSVAEGNAAGGNAAADTAEDERSHGSLSQRTLPWDSSQNE